MGVGLGGRNHFFFCPAQRGLKEPYKLKTIDCQLRHLFCNRIEPREIERFSRIEKSDKHKLYHVNETMTYPIVLVRFMGNLSLLLWHKDKKNNDSWRLVCSTYGTRLRTLTASWMHNFFSSSILSDNFSKRASFLAAKAVNLSRSTALGREDKLSPVGGKRVFKKSLNITQVMMLIYVDLRQSPKTHFP